MRAHGCKCRSIRRRQPPILQTMWRPRGCSGHSQKTTGGKGGGGGRAGGHVCMYACMYLPCAGCSREQYANALLGLQDDFELYLAHSRTIYLAGDFNAHVGCQSSPAVPPDLRMVTPLHGEATVNANGRALLQLRRDNNADFVSGRSMTAPTCIGHGRNGSTLQVGTSVVDRVLRVRGDVMRTLALPACTTLDHATHGPALQLLASDHCPVLFFYGSRAPTATAKRSARTTWRLELLHQQRKRVKRTSLPCGRAHDLQLRSGLWARVTKGGVDRMASAVVDIFTDSATAELAYIFGWHRGSGAHAPA